MRVMSPRKVVAEPERFTTVPVKAPTLRAFQACRAGGKNYDAGIQDFMEANPPESFWREVLRRAREPELTLAQLSRKLGL
jgi:hypothetical protein